VGTSLLKVKLQCTNILRYRGGIEMSGGTAHHLSVEGDTAM
jgi:hypothetical protein